MLNCKETTRLLSESLDHRLTWWQRMNLGMHVMMCGACNTYKRQIEGIHRLLGKTTPHELNGQMKVLLPGEQLSTAKKEEIKSVVQSAIDPQ